MRRKAHPYWERQTLPIIGRPDVSISNLASEPTLLAGFQVVRMLGAGGFGRVFEAVDPLTEQRLALKLLSRVNPKTLARFKHEFRAVQGIHHPSLVRLDRLIEHEGRWLIVMELVDGTDLIQYVRAGQNDPGFHEARVRSAFAQLAEALAALHAAGIVHRDLKPNNVRVTEEGRVVLLDFGLATHMDPRDQSTNAGGVGTVAYMAPEQATGTKVGPSADWYAFGVSLYEALTGEYPIDAVNAVAIALKKQTVQPTPPSKHVSGVPNDLEALCLQLLSIAPEQRPGAEHVVRTLAPGQVAVPEIRERRSVPRPELFMGRQGELDALAANLARARRGEQRVVLVEGESGIGKSELVEQFLRQLTAEQPDAIVLRSRCYENEQLAYKAFDGALDELARQLTRLDQGRCVDLLPPRADLLKRVFPVFARVAAIDAAPPKWVSADPSVLRLEAFGVLARLLEKLAEQRAVVVAIDDLQWADAESFRLLATLLSDAHPPSILLLATVRPTHELEPDVAASVATIRAARVTEVVPLAGLEPEQAEALAGMLLGPRLPKAWLESISQESRGHPLFLTVLARFAESHDLRANSDLTLDAALGARIGSLSREAQRLLYTVALAGSPQSTHVCAKAAGIAEQHEASLVAELCGQKLLRRRRAARLACFHDQVRRVVLDQLVGAQARELHKRLAQAMEEEDRADPAEIARHYEAAGERWLAFLAYQTAAKTSLHGLAFARAATLFTRALELGEASALDDAWRVELMILRGHALARSGRSAEAAQQYLSAVSLATGEQRVQLRLWAAQHLLQSAQVEAGMRAARELLQDLKIPLAKSERGMLFQLTYDRMLLRMRGLEVKAPAPQPSSADERLRLEALGELVLPLNLLDLLPGAVLTAKHLRRSLASGDARHMAKALCSEATLRTGRGRSADEVAALFARARQLADAAPSADLEARLLFNEGAAALMRWHIVIALQRLEQAEQTCMTRCPDRTFLLTNIRMLLGFARAYRGEHRLLVDQGAVWLAEARERDDRFASAVLVGFGHVFIRHLMDDAPEAALQEIQGAMQPWPREPYAFAHHGELLATLFAELYRGGAGAMNWLEQEAPRLERALLLRLQSFRAAYVVLGATARLSAWVDAPKPQANALIERVRSDLKELARARDPLAIVQSGRLRIMLAMCAGRSEDALRELGLLRVRLPADQDWMNSGYDYVAGVIEGGERGRALSAQALARVGARGWKNPQASVDALWPMAKWYQAKQR
jgi:hypothetical protein